MNILSMVIYVNIINWLQVFWGINERWDGWSGTGFQFAHYLYILTEQRIPKISTAKKLEKRLELCRSGAGDRTQKNKSKKRTFWRIEGARSSSSCR